LAREQAGGCVFSLIICLLDEHNKESILVGTLNFQLNCMLPLSNLFISPQQGIGAAWIWNHSEQNA